MPNRRTIVSALFFATASLATVSLAGCGSMGQTDSGWVSLMDGKSLAGWNQLGAGNWRVEDGMVVGDKGKAGFLVSSRTYKDFMVRAEFWVSDDANSGVFLRGSDAASVTGTNSYEVNIFDKRPDPSFGTGAIVYIAKPLVAMTTGGRWNTYEIVAKGSTLTVTLNGVRTVDGVQDTKHASGFLALQSDGGVVKFRRVDIKEL